MAEVLDDGEFWLPPQFLTDDDLLMDFKSNTDNNHMSNGDKFNDAGVYFPYEFSNGFGSFGPDSDLSSPVESVVGSTETESDEEDFLAQKMARSTLQDDFWNADNALGYENTKLWPMSGSPQSTLCTVLGGKQGSSRGSPNCPSQVSSPPAMGAANRNEAAWDLLYAAAGEVARMRLVEDGSGCYQNRGLLGPPRKPSPVSVPLKNSNPNIGFHSNHSLSYQQLQATQFQQLKLQQIMKQQSTVGWGHSKAGGGQFQLQRAHQMVQNGARINNGGLLGLSQSAWPTLQQSQQQQQQPAGSGMRAVFLGSHGSKRECTGTGVFLPRRIGTTTETCKKPACSTVLLPDRVVQALNLNLEAMDTQPHHQRQHYRSFTPDYDAALRYRNNVLMTQQRRNVRPQPGLNNEVRLPQEWTY